MEGNLRWGILGLGKIAHSFAKDLQLVEGSSLQAVASRSIDKAIEFGRQYSVQHTFGSYEQLLASDAVDVVYIATPHTSHAKWSILAMELGKHVLCEKPMGVNSGEVARMIAAARKNRVFLMEALWSRFNPSIREVKKRIEEGAIGDLNYLYADFGFYALDRDPRGRLLNPDLAGGSLLDIGIYPVFLAYLLLGKPVRILSSVRTLDTGIEIQAAMIFEYPGSQALLFSGLGSRTGMQAEIGGTAGTFYLHPRWHETQGYSLDVEGEVESFKLPTLGKGYAHEILEVQECLRENRLESGLWSLQNSQDLIGLLDKIRADNGLVFPFEE